MTQSIQTTYSPIDNSAYVIRTQASQQQIDDAITLAINAQRDWAKTPIAQRQQICRDMLNAFIINQDEICQQLCWMIGRPISYCQGEVAGMIERASYMIDIAPGALADMTLPPTSDVKRYIKATPLGVVLILAPWNYPYLTAINSIIPAIMSGNAIILKHSSQTPLCAEQLASAFKTANLPRGVFQYLHLSHLDCQHLIKQGPIDYVAFTGSVAGGKMVEQAASGKFIGIGLELGGKDPAYVRADADIDDAVATVIDGAFFNSGQSCCAIERLYLHRDIYQQFLTKAVALVKQYQLKLPTDPTCTLGPVVNSQAADLVRQQIKDAIASGAKAHIPSSDFTLAQLGSPYLAPQLLTQVDHDMAIMKDESFGPVLAIMQVDNDQQAIELMNDSQFGLTASVFSADVSVAQAMGELVNCGTFFVNRCDYLDPALAWTGLKNSGRGCSLSSLAYQTFTQPKSFYLKS